MLKKSIIALATGLTLTLAVPAHAACYADYKAKQENPLRLHYGVVKLPDSACKGGRAKANVQNRLAANGWQLLKIVSTFDDSGLASRKSSAGGFFLKF